MRDEVLEYRVWCHPHEGAEDLVYGDNYFYAFETCEIAPCRFTAGLHAGASMKQACQLCHLSPLSRFHGYIFYYPYLEA